MNLTMNLTKHEDRVFRKLFCSDAFAQRLVANEIQFGREACISDLVCKLDIRHEVAKMLVEDVLDTDLEKFAREWVLDKD